MTSDRLELFHPPVRDWFRTSFAAPTKPQEVGWPPIAVRKSWYPPSCQPTPAGAAVR